MSFDHFCAHLRFARAATDHMAAVLRDLGVTGVRPSWIAALAEMTDGRPRTIQAFQPVIAANASYAVAHMIELGLLTARRVNGDRRVRYVVLTEQGRGLLKRVEAQMTALDLTAQRQARVSAVMAGEMVAEGALA